MKIKTLLVDDEIHCLDMLNHMINNNCGTLTEVVGTAISKADAIDKIVKLQPELVFLDVKLGDDLGFDVVKECPQKNFKTIFVSGYDHFAIQAMRLSAIDYLLKPIEPDELISAVNKMNSLLPNQHDLLFHNLSSMGQSNPKLAIPSLHGFEFISVRDIVRCESSINYTKVFSKNAKPIMVAKTLKEFEKLLVPFNFCRVHNSHLVNMDYIKSYNRGKGGVLIMEDSTEIEVSFRKKEGFLQKLLFLD